METANLNKTTDAAILQIEDIKLIKKKNKFEDLPNELKEVALLRLENHSIYTFFYKKVYEYKFQLLSKDKLLIFIFLVLQHNY